MGEEAVFALPTPITSLEMMTQCCWIAAEAASGTEFATTIPVSGPPAMIHGHDPRPPLVNAHHRA